MATPPRPGRSGLPAGPARWSCIAEGLRESGPHRRLARYLVRADLHKHGSDTLLGNVWWILDPLLQMAVYVVLVSIIFRVGKPDYPALRLRGDPALEVVLVRRQRRDPGGHVA